MPCGYKNIIYEPLKESIRHITKRILNIIDKSVRLTNNRFNNDGSGWFSCHNLVGDEYYDV